MARAAVVINLISGLLLSQQLMTARTGEGRGPERAPPEYEDLIRPRLITEGADEAERLYSFAARLLDSGNYEQAALEFRRFTHFYPGHQLGGEAAYAAAWARFKGGVYDEAAAWFRRVYMSSRDREIRARALFMMAESDYRSGDYTSAIDIYEMVSERFSGSPLSHRAAFMMGWGYLELGRWRDASQLFSSLAQDSPYFSLAEGLAEEALQGETLRRKSPFLAGVLSAYAPGAGQLYVGRNRDALVAFLINQGFIVGAVASIYSGNLFLGVTLLALEVGWYSGNVYSALNGAHKYNRRVREHFLGTIHLKYGLK